MAGGYQVRSSVFAHRIPNCCGEEQYKAWCELATYVPLQYPNSGFCIDCTPEYQADMVAEGRCENPGIIFSVDKDGFVYGHWPTINDIRDGAALDREFKAKQREEAQMDLLASIPDRWRGLVTQK